MNSFSSIFSYRSNPIIPHRISFLALPLAVVVQERAAQKNKKSKKVETVFPTFNFLTLKGWRNCCDRKFRSHHGEPFFSSLFLSDMCVGSAEKLDVIEGKNVIRRRMKCYFIFRVWLRRLHTRIASNFRCHCAGTLTAESGESEKPQQKKTRRSFALLHFFPSSLVAKAAKKEKNWWFLIPHTISRTREIEKQIRQIEFSRVHTYESLEFLNFDWAHTFLSLHNICFSPAPHFVSPLYMW